MPFACIDAGFADGDSRPGVVFSANPVDVRCGSVAVVGGGGGVVVDAVVGVESYKIGEPL